MQLLFKSNILITYDWKHENNLHFATLSRCFYMTVYTDTDHNNTLQQFSSTTASTSTVNCSPRWSVYTNLYTDVDRSSNWWIRTATTEQQCLDVCFADTSCVAADFYYRAPYRCRIHHQMRPYIRLNGIKRFEIVRPCILSSGT